MKRNAIKTIALCVLGGACLQCNPSLTTPTQLGPMSDETSDEAVETYSGGMNDIWFVGDSILVGTEPYVRELLGSAHSLTFRGKVGDSIPARFPYLQEAASAGADALVIQLGINDVGGGCPVSESTIRSRIAGAMDAVSSIPCVVWANYQTNFPSTTYYPALLCSAPVLNRLLAEEAASRPWIKLVDFRAIIDPQYGAFNGGDGLHLNAAGSRALAEAYQQGLAQCHASCERGEYDYSNGHQCDWSEIVENGEKFDQFNGRYYDRYFAKDPAACGQSHVLVRARDGDWVCKTHRPNKPYPCAGAGSYKGVVCRDGNNGYGGEYCDEYWNADCSSSYLNCLDPVLYPKAAKGGEWCMTDYWLSRVYSPEFM